MAMTQKQRDERTSLRRSKAQEEELRLRVRPGTRQALAELMEWANIEEQGEALTLMIHHLHGLGRGGALPLLEIPLHKIELSQSVVRNFRMQSMLMLRKDGGDEVIDPLDVTEIDNGRKIARSR